jgi:hypothetical protein
MPLDERLGDYVLVDHIDSGIAAEKPVFRNPLSSSCASADPGRISI